MFTASKLTTYLVKKFFRYMPLNIVAMLSTIFILPYVGSGPVWNNFASVVYPCTSHSPADPTRKQGMWWTNVLWINNLYPVNYDDKCLPWTWFIPCYVQLSLLLPLILSVYAKVANKCVSGLIYLALGIAALGFTFLRSYQMNLGATVVRNEEFFAQVYMSPLFHFSSFFLGIIVSLVYMRYIEERAEASAIQNSFSSRLLEMISHNAVPRYSLYLLGLAAMIYSVIWQTPFVGKPLEQT